MTSANETLAIEVFASMIFALIFLATEEKQK